jgi:Multiubiquitin
MEEPHERERKTTENQNEFNIIVNGRPKKVPGPSISFERVVALAFNPVPPNAFFTVTWSHGNQGGSLTPGKSVQLQNGMKFDATETGQS